MAEIFTEDERKFLEALVKNKVEFMLVGLAAATLQGAPVVTQDIDLWFSKLPTDNLLKALKEVGVKYIPPFGHSGPVFAKAELFDIVLSMTGLGTYEEEVNNTILVSLGKNLKVKVLKLERIIESKKALNRPKDRLVLPVLEDVLQVIKKQQE